MPSKPPIRIAVQLLLLAIGVFAVYRIWIYQPPAPTMIGDGDADDLPPPVVDVQLTKISRQTLHAYGEYLGVVEPAPALEGHPPASAVVTPPMNVVVAEVDCSENQPVSKGQPLFKLAGAANDTLGQTIIAPLSGTVVSLSIHPGERYGPAGGGAAGVGAAGVGAVEIVDLSRLVVALSIPQNQLPLIEKGQAIEIEKATDVAAWNRIAAAPPGDSSATPATAPPADIGPPPSTAPSASIASQVVSIDRRIDPATGMGSCDVAIPAALPIAKLVLGQAVRVRITLKTFPDALTVPAASIVSTASGQPAINLVRQDLLWSSQIPVTLLTIDGPSAAIAGDNLHPDDPVVSVGAYGLPTRARIHVVGE